MAGKLGSWIKRHWIVLSVLYVLLLAASHYVIAKRETPDPLADPTKNVLELEGQRLAYVEWGGADKKKPPFILLHGSPSGGAKDFTKFAEELALTGRRIIAIDRWGYGASERWVKDYSFEADAKAVVGLMDQLGIQSAHVGGWSYGGGPAILLGDQEPKRIRSVSLIAAIGMQEGEGSGSHLIEHAKYSAAYGLAMGLPEVVPHFGLLGSRAARHTFGRDFSDCDQRSLKARLLSLEVPLFIIHGKNDPLVPAWVAQEHHLLQAKSRLVILNSSHFFPFGFGKAENFKIATEEQAAFLAAADRGKTGDLYGMRNETAREDLRSLWDGGPPLRGYKPWWVVLFAAVVVGLIIPRTGAVIVGIGGGVLAFDFLTALAGVIIGAICRRGESRTRFHKAVGVLLFGLLGSLVGALCLPFF